MGPLHMTFPLSNWQEMVSVPWVLINPSSHTTEMELPSWKLSPKRRALIGMPGSGHSLWPNAGVKQRHGYDEENTGLLQNINYTLWALMWLILLKICLIVLKPVKFIDYCNWMSCNVRWCNDEENSPTFWEMGLFANQPVRTKDRFQFPSLFVCYGDVFSLN